MNAWRSSKPYFLTVSLALNIAFVGAWLASGAWANLIGHTDATAAKSAPSEIWCPLHRKLGVTIDQWKKIEPKLTEFRQNAQSICARVTRSRLELVELLASTAPDRAALKAKQEEILAGQRNMQDLSLAYLLEEKQLLTGEQERGLLAMIREQSKCSAQGPFRGFGGGTGPAGDDGVEPATTSTASR